MCADGTLSKFTPCFFKMPAITTSTFYGKKKGSTLLIIPIKDGEEIRQSDPGHFCYSNELVPGWKETWTRIQIQVRSSQKFKVTVVEDEEKLKELEQFNFWTLFQYFIKERSNETTIGVNLFSSKTCFKVEPSDKTTSYTISLTRRFDPYLFLVFLAGLLLFFFADTLSRFAEFVEGGSHLIPSEVSLHEQEYGLWGSIFEEEFFENEEEEELFPLHRNHNSV